MSERGYNGWKNYQTWNVAIWIGNDEGLYRVALESKGDYEDFAKELRELGTVETPDKVAYNDSGLDTDALDDMLRELRGDEEDEPE
jgi:hypothetical protein